MTIGPIHLTKACVLALTIAALALPGLALADPSVGKGTPDWFERYVAAHPYGEGSVASTAAAPDWFERYVAAHPYGEGSVASTAPAPDWFERYVAAHPFGHRFLAGRDAARVQQATATPISGLLVDDWFRDQVRIIHFHRLSPEPVLFVDDWFRDPR
jgi:hypothetical protein